jgi:DNA-binding PadR family transcriptional regulator
MVRRKPGQLLPLEVDLLTAAAERAGTGDPEFHGFAIARQIAEGDPRRLTAHGTLYKALGRLADAGLLSSRWEDPATAEAEGRPRRRLYRVTGDGELAVRAARQSAPAAPERDWGAPRPGTAPA